MQDITAEGYPAQQVLLQLQSEILAAPSADGSSTTGSSTIGAKQKAIICEVLAHSDKCLVDGADEFLQLLNVAAQVQKALTS